MRQFFLTGSLLGPGYDELWGCLSGNFRQAFILVQQKLRRFHVRKLACLCGLVLALAVSASAQDYPKAGDFGVYHNSTGAGANTVTYLFGPKFAYRHSDKLTPYFHFLLGGAHLSGTSAFALAFGGGFDAKVTPHVAIRLIQADYVLTKFNDGANNRQNNARISAGIV